MSEHDHDHDPAPHQAHHGHGHSHGHDSEPRDERSFDWASAADSIELDAEVMRPVVDAALGRVDLSSASRLLDLGSGPGVMANLMACLAPRAQVVAADGSPQLLARAAATASANGTEDRLRIRPVDLDTVAVAELAQLLLDGGPPFDLVWASMVLHHVIDAPGVLRALREAIAPGGTIVLVELGGDLEIFAEGSTDAMVTSGAWDRWRATTAAAMREHLPDGAMDLRWDDELRAAGFVDVSAELVRVDHAAPLDDARRAWMTWFLRNGLAHGGSRLSDADREEMSTFVDGIATGRTSDLVVSTSRTLVVGRRPG